MLVASGSACIGGIAEALRETCEKAHRLGESPDSAPPDPV